LHSNILMFNIPNKSYSWNVVRRVWRYQMGVIRICISKKNRQHNGQKEKVQKDKQRSTKHTYKTKDRVTWTPLITAGELRCSGSVSGSCSTSGTRRVNLVTNPVISREWGKDREVFATSGTYPWSFVRHIFHNGQPSHGDNRKIFEVMTSTLPKGTLGSVASLVDKFVSDFWQFGGFLRKFRFPPTIWLTEAIYIA
jgi:hypothetical protein